MSVAEGRLLHPDITALPLEHEPGEHDATLGHAALYEAAGMSVGVWEAGPGEDRDVEADEVFLVLSGNGSITFDDDSVVELRPGTLVRLYAGDRTVWRIENTVRKLYVAPPGQMLDR